MSRVNKGFALGAALAVVLAAGTSQAVETVVLDSIGPQPAAESVKPGLAPVYFYDRKFDWINEFYDWPKEKGKPGPPLLVVNYHTGSDRVLTSDDYDLVGARIEGYIHLDKPGMYEFAFESNDGVRLEIEGKLVVEDPNVHADQFSEVGKVKIATAGWYPLVIWYFEKKNTSTLRFLWKKPGGNANAPMTIVPGKVLAHAAGS